MKDKIMKKRFYVVYDVRAMLDGSTDNASVMEAIGDYKSTASAIKDANECWGDYEYALYSYALRGGELVDEKFEHYHPA